MSILWGKPDGGQEKPNNKVVLGVGNPGAEEWLRANLTGYEVAGSADTPREILALVQKTGAGLVILARRGPQGGVGGLEALIPELRTKAPGTRIILIAGERDREGQALLDLALAHGVYDVISCGLGGVITAEDVLRAVKKPATWDDVAALRSLVPYGAGGGGERIVKVPEKVVVPEYRPSTLIAVIGFKGGIGKTTTSANLAAVFGLKYKNRVAALDLNLSTPTLGIQLGATMEEILNPDLGLLGIHNDPAPGPLAKYAIQKHNVDLLIGPGVDGRHHFLPDESFFVKVLEQARREYSIVVVDTSQAIDDLSTYVAMTQANTVVLVADQDRQTLVQTRGFLEIAQRLGVTKDKIRLVINRYNPKLGDSRPAIEDYLGIRASALVPEDRAAYIRATEEGRPVALTQKNGPWHTLARAVLGEEVVVEEPKEKRAFGWLRALFARR